MDRTDHGWLPQSQVTGGALLHLGALGGGGVPPGEHLDNGNSGGGRAPYLRFTVMQME